VSFFVGFVELKAQLIPITDAEARALAELEKEKSIEAAPTESEAVAAEE